jgi:hypothetical protein
MSKLFRLICIPAIIICLFTANAQLASAKKSSSKKSAKAKVERGRSAKQSRGKKETSRKGRREISQRGGKKLSRRERAQLARETRRGRGRGRYSRHHRTYTARTYSAPARNEATLKALPEAPLHVGDEDPQPPPSQYVAPVAAPAPRASGIAAERVIEIQNALKKNGYYQGEATGVYDDNTKQAMKQFQTANNLQSSGLPSAHALNKLGVAKRKNDDYAVPVKSAKDKDKNAADKEKNSPQ